MLLYFFRAAFGFLLQTLPPAFLCIYPFWTRLSQERKRPILFFFFGGFLILALFIAMIFIDTLSPEQRDSNVNMINLFMFLEQFCCFVIYMLVIKDHFFKKLFFLTFVSSFFAGTALVASFLNRLLFPNVAMGIFVQDGYLWTLPSLVFFFVLSAIGFCAVFFILKRMTRYMFDFDQPVFWRNLCVLPVLFYLWIFITPNDLIYGWIIVSATLIMLLLEIFIALFSIQNMALLTAAQATVSVETPSIDSKETLSHEAYLTLNEKLQQYEIFAHDWKHQLFIFKRMLSDGAIEPATQHIDTLLAELTSIKPPLLSGNYLIDTLVNGHLSTLAKKGISIDAEATIPEILPFDYEVLYTLLHELLKGATQGCESILPGPAGLTLKLDLVKNDLHILCGFPSFETEPILFENLENILGNDMGTISFSKNEHNSEISVVLTPPKS